LTVERRAKQRFPLDLALRFTVSKGYGKQVQGSGVVVNISSSGLAFRTEAELTTGLPIEASMEWPVVLNGDCVLRVILEGHVVRAETGLAVMTVARYEFRTGGRLGIPPRPEMQALKRRLDNLLAPAWAGASLGRVDSGPRPRQMP